MKGCGEQGTLPSELARQLVAPALTAFDQALASVFTAGSHEQQREQAARKAQLQAALHQLAAAAQGATALVASLEAGPHTANGAGPANRAAQVQDLGVQLQRHCVRVAGDPALDLLLAALQVRCCYCCMLQPGPETLFPDCTDAACMRVDLQKMVL